MDQTIKRTWDLMMTTVDEHKKITPEIDCNESCFGAYEKLFNDWYSYIKKNYMEEDVEFLDRHKVSAIIIISILQSDAVICSKEIVDNEIFIGQYLVAVSVGMTYMLNRLNSVLLKKLKRPIDELWMPKTVFSCNVPYFEIFCRNLYFAHNEKKWGLNPLGIAKELFLLEYITIEKKGIDPYTLKEEKALNALKKSSKWL